MIYNEKAEEIKKQIDSKQFEIGMRMAKRQEYMENADRMREVYDKLADDKQDTIGQKDIMFRVRDTEMSEFKGDVHNNRYAPQIDNIINALERVISGIDANMDALNTRIAEEQNKAYAMDGLIGQLEQGINGLNNKLWNDVN